MPIIPQANFGGYNNIASNLGSSLQGRLSNLMNLFNQQRTIQESGQGGILSLVNAKQQQDQLRESKDARIANERLSRDTLGATLANSAADRKVGWAGTAINKYLKEKELSQNLDIAGLNKDIEELKIIEDQQRRAQEQSNLDRSFAEGSRQFNINEQNEEGRSLRQYELGQEGLAQDASQFGQSESNRMLVAQMENALREKELEKTDLSTALQHEEALSNVAANLEVKAKEIKSNPKSIRLEAPEDQEIIAAKILNEHLLKYQDSLKGYRGSNNRISQQEYYDATLDFFNQQEVLDILNYLPEESPVKTYWRNLMINNSELFNNIRDNKTPEAYKPRSKRYIDDSTFNTTLGNIEVGINQLMEMVNPEDYLDRRLSKTRQYK